VGKDSEICGVGNVSDCVSDWNEVTGAYTDGGGSSNRCCWALKALEQGRDIGMILARSMCDVSKDGMVVNGCADCHDDWEPARNVSGGDGPMKWDGPVNCGQDAEGTYCIAINTGYY